MGNLYGNLKDKEVVKLVTHNGRFHADDVASYAILDMLFSDNDLKRTRDADVIRDADVVFDVGGGRFDHHMVDKKYRECGLPYASVGLIWEEFGRDVIRNIAYSCSSMFSYEFDDADVEYMFKSFDDDFVKPLDAGDNGVNCVDVIVAEPYSVYKIVSNFNLPKTFVGALYESVDEAEMDRFKEASKMVQIMIDGYFINILAEVAGNFVVREAYSKRVDPRYIVLEDHVNWENELRRLDVDEEVLFVVYPYDDVNEYRIQVVRKFSDRFEARKNLPESWSGLRDEELANVTGVDDAVFCHTGLFLGVARSQEGIMKMLEKALG